LQATRYGNGVTNLYQYDSLNRLTNLTWKLNAGNLANFTYLLGATGNRTNLTESVNGTNRVYAWQYDALYRLTNENFNASSNLAYSYDPVGNRTNRTSSVGVLTNQNFTFNTNDWLTTDHYDNNGNTTNSSGIFYNYDVMNHLTNLNGTMFITYDGDGNRVSKSTGGTSTFYLLDDRNPSGYAQVLEEWTVTTTATNVSKVYNYGLNLISQRAPGTSTNYFVYDGHGSTRLLVDIGGNVQNLFAYDAYGTLIASNASPQTLYLYCGQQFDQNLGLYYNRARYLNAGTGRFWTMDDTDGNNEDPLSLHKYLYGECNPIDNEDPSGNAAFSSAEAAAIGRQVHTIIEKDFVRKVPGGVTAESVFTTLGLPTGPNPIRKIGQKLGRIFPDLVNVEGHEVYEIKPVTIAGSLTGFAQLYAYITLFNKLNPEGHWHDGNSYDYQNNDGSDVIELASPPSVIVVAPTVSGMIYYEAFTIDQLGKVGAKIVGRADMNDINQSLGISTLITIL
jgi:RHS repeat-associated protein